MRPGFRNLSYALIVVGATALACVLYWLSLINTQSVEIEAARRRAELRATQLSEAATQEVDATLRSVDIALKHLRTVYINDPTAFDRAARDLRTSYPSGMMQHVSVFDADGRLVYPAHPRQDHLYFSDREQSRAHVESGQDQLFISPPFFGYLAGVPIIQITRPIRNGKHLLGTIGIGLRPDYLSAKLGALQIDPEDLMAVVRTDGQFIARSQDLEEALHTKLPPDRPFLQAQPDERGIYRGPSATNGVPLLFAWRRLSEWPLSVFAAVNEEKELGLISLLQTQQRNHTRVSMALALACALGIAVFIIRIKQKNEELARSEVRYRALFEHSQLPMMLIESKDGSIVNCNLAAAKYYGYSRQQLQRMLIFDINILPRAEITAEMELAKAEKRDCFHFLHRLANGEVRQVEVHSGPLQIGERLLLYSIILDISARRAAEAALISEAERLSALLETASDGIHILNEAGNLIEFSDSFAAMLGYTNKEISRLNVADWDDQIPKSKIQEMIQVLVKSPQKFETRHRRKNGTVIDVEINAKGFEIGGTTYLYAASRDITERKQNEAELKRHRDHLEELVEERTTALYVAKEAAETANRAKTTFLANMSHELRTPMNAIMGLTAIALRRTIDPQQINQLTKVNQASQRLLGIINDILDIAKIEAERLSLERTDFKLGSVLENLRVLIGDKAAERGLRLRIDLPPELADQLLSGDRLRLGQILVNLAGNALKFTTEGSISVRVQKIDERPNDIVLRFEVRDTGIGISAEDQRRLFTAFEQGDGSVTRRFGGAGLGLAISKRLAQMMGGAIGADSRPGTGSLFWFTARIAKSTLAAGQIAAKLGHTVEEELKARYSGTRILLVENDRPTQNVSRLQLEEVGLKVDIAEDGDEAVAMARLFDYALILIDIQLPATNGINAALAIREIPGRQKTPILAMTPRAFEQDREHWVNAGMNDHISKPVDPDKLYVILLQWLSQDKWAE